MEYVQKFTALKFFETTFKFKHQWIHESMWKLMVWIQPVLQ